MNDKMETGAPAKVAPESKMMLAALLYAARFNCSVLPCREREKTPITAHGVKDASKDPAVIRQWWSRYPAANIGIACGKASGGLLVLDVDGEEGKESLNRMEAQHGLIPVTPSVLTGKGQQYYFKTALEYKNRVRVAPGIDIRADAGYVLAPPSIHPNGKTYVWEISGRIDEVPFAPVPAWLVTILSGSDAGNERKDWSEIAAHGAPCGARNQTLASVAGHLFRKNVDPKLAYALLMAWNEICLERPLSRDEADRTINSIAMAEAARRMRGAQ